MQGIESLNNFKSFVSSLGGLGRFEDTYIVHAAEGETVVPMEVLDRNPALKKRLFQSMIDMGIEPGRYIVGNELNSKNPVTGQPEFFLKQIGARLRKAAADISGYAAPVIGALYGAPAGAAAGALLGQYKRENPGDPTQGLQMALRGGLTGLGTNIATGQGMFGTGLSGRASQLGTGIFDVFKNPGDFFLDKAEGGTGKSFIRNAIEKYLGIGEGSGSTVKKEFLEKYGDKTLNDIPVDELSEFLSGTSGDKKIKLVDALKAGVPLTLALGFLIDQTTDEGPVGMPLQELPEGQVKEGIVNPIGVFPGLETRAEGGVMDLRQGGESEGPGTGTSDDIPAMLSDGEFVMTAKAVRGAGGGDRREGAKRMYQMMDNLEAGGIMVTSTTTTIPVLPDYAQQPTVDIAKTLEAVLDKPLQVPMQQVAGLSPTQVSAMNLAQQGIGSFQPFLQAAQDAQTAGLGTLGAGAQTVAGAEFVPTQATLDRFMDPYQQNVTQEALKEIDRQQQIAENRLAGQAVKAGAFGGSRFGVAQSELARNAQDLRSRRIFEDLSRNFQQAQASARAANQQRIQAGQVFGQLGRGVSGIGGAMAGLGAQQQALQRQDVGQLLGIGGLQQQQAQRELDVGTANLAAMQNAPFQQLSAGAGILQQLLPGQIGSQVVAPLAQTNPYAQAAGLAATAAGGLGALIGN